MTTLTVIFQIILITNSLWCLTDAYASTKDKFGNNASILSVSITPTSVSTGTYPKIVGIVQNTSRRTNGKKGKALFDIIVAVTYPNGAKKSWRWHDAQFSARQKKAFTCVNGYDINQVGIYKVEYFVYNKGRSHLYSSLSKSFISAKASAVSLPSPSSMARSKTIEEPSLSQPKTQPASDSTKQSGMSGQRTIPVPAKELSSFENLKPSVSERRMIVGIGGYINTLNFSAGPGIIVWPVKNLAIQGAYGFGTFTSYEARVFYRFPLSRYLNPYLGVGYLHTERQATVIGINTKIKGDSATAFGGVEWPVYKNLSVYIDISATPLTLKGDITNGSQVATVKVRYSPITVYTGLVLYIF